MGFEIADLRALGADYTGQMVVYLAAGANPISEAAWETYQPDPGFMLNTPRAGQFDVLNVLGSPYQPTGSFTFYTDSAGYTWQAVAAVENRVYPFDAADYEGSSPPITTSAQAGYQLSTPLPGTIQYNSNDKNHENVYYAKDGARNPILQYFVTDPWSNVYILKSVNAANDTPDKVAAAVDAAVLPSEDWVKSSGYLANDQSYLSTYSGNVAHANEFRDSADSAWMQISWGSLGITLPAVVGEGMPIWGGSSDDYLVGTDADDEIHSGGGDDTIAGVDGSDRISGDAGNDRIEGGNGTTTAVFFGTSIEYSIQYMPTSIVVTDSVVGRDGTDTLINVQSLEFSDGTIVPCFAAGTVGYDSGDAGGSGAEASAQSNDEADASEQGDGEADALLASLTETFEGLGATNIKASGGSTTTTAEPSSGGTVTSYTSGASGAYNITITFNGTWTSSLQGVFKAAADRLSDLITGDVPDVRVNGKIIDDINISAELESIDGVGGLLGQAGPTALRSDSYLPAAAAMQFDSADAHSYYDQGLFDEIVTHEILHCVGFASIWGYLGLTEGPSFIGPHAVAEYNKLVDEYATMHGGSTILSNGITLAKGSVPLETGGGSDTAGSHWSEAVFDNEMMTGYINLPISGSTAPADPLSMMTVASLRDLGYDISSASQLDAYILT